MEKQKSGDGVFVPYRQEKRRFLAGLLAVVVAGGLLVSSLATIHFGRTVIVEDRFTILESLGMRIPSSLLLQHSCWGDLEVADFDLLNQISSLLQQLPGGEPLEPGGETGCFKGRLFYPDGSEQSIAFADTLHLGGIAYDLKEHQLEYRSIQKALCQQFYHPNRLANLLEETGEVVLSGGGEPYILNRLDRALLAESVRNCRAVEEQHSKVVQAVRGQTLRYTVRLYGDTGGSMLNIHIYGDGTALVYDTCSHNQYLLCLSGPLDAFCQQLAGPQ